MLNDNNTNTEPKSSPKSPLFSNNHSQGAHSKESISQHLKHCISEVMQDGSSLYYALLFCTPKQKTSLVGFNYLVKELYRGAHKLIDLNLRNLKSLWWKNEIKQLINDISYHPALICLGSEYARKIGQERFDQLFQSLSVERGFPRYFTVEERKEDALNWSGTGFEACAIILNIKERKTIKCVKELGACYMILTQNINIAKALSNGWHPFPVETLQKYNVSAEQLRQRKSSPEFFEMFKEECGGTITLGESLWKSLSNQEQRQLHPLRTLWRIRLAEYKLYENSATSLLLETNKITPLRKLWLAWSSYILRR